tara:strand:- start:212 stop:586 length:375 start_codon:yes stop_codon:yes gene_type:complete
MANMKRIEKRLEQVEDWMKQFEKDTGPKMVMENMNWLLEQLRMAGDQFKRQEGTMIQLQTQLEQNSMFVQSFLEEEDMVLQFQSFLVKKQEEANAVQKSKAKSMDAQEQAEDGEEVGEGDPEGK